MLKEQLGKIGLADKEAKVFLASLELGSSAVQEIAKRADINRATTYVIIEKMMKKGLMSSVEKGKKTYFQTEDPKRLLKLLEEQEEGLKRKEEEFKKYLPELETLFNIAQEKPKAFNERVKRGIKFKLLYSDIEKDKSKRESTSERFLPKNKFPLSSSFIIYDNKAAVVSMKGKLIGVIIESKEIVNTFKSIFELAWEGSEKYQ